MQCNSLYTKDIFYERLRTKDYVRNFNLFMQNEPKYYNPCIILTARPERTYNNFRPSDFPKNEPKRTQNEPKVKIGKIEPNPLFKKVLYQFLPLRTYKNEPKRTQNKPKTNPIKPNLWLYEIILRNIAVLRLYWLITKTRQTNGTGTVQMKGTGLWKFDAF